MEHSCCTFSTGIFSLLPYTLHWNIVAVRSLQEHSCCYSIPSTGTFLLYVLYWNILAVTLYPPLEHPCCYSIPSTGIFLLLLYTLPWNILFVTVHPPFVPVKVERTSNLHFRNSTNRTFFSFGKLQGNNNFELLLLTRKLNVPKLNEDLSSRP